MRGSDSQEVLGYHGYDYSFTENTIRCDSTDAGCHGYVV